MTPNYSTPPGETLQELLDAKGLSQTDLALMLRRPIKTINEIVKGKAAITPETAIQFEKKLRVPAEFWLTMQALHDLAKARKRKTKDLYENRGPQRIHAGL